MRPIERFGLRDLAPRYRCLFVDAYGVLYDGAAPFPGAADALRLARDAGLKICIVTNSASRVSVVADRLAQRAGVGPAHYDAIATSGELSWRYVTEGNIARDLPLFVITEDGGPSWVKDIPNPQVADVSAAGAMLAVGISHFSEAALAASNLAQTLQAAAGRHLPLIVADSDETYPWRGVMRLGAGRIARMYEAMGGPLVEFGKPCRPIYAEASRLLDGPAVTDILAVGDNLLTDIRGATTFGIDSLLVLEGGVHGGEQIDDLLRTSPVQPTFVSPRLSW